MQRTGSILFALSLSVLIIYGGSGVNAYFYCCGDCRTEGHNAVMENKCCHIHHHTHDGNAVAHGEQIHFGEIVAHHVYHTCDQFIGDFHNECGVDRIQFDWQSYQVGKVQFHPTVISLDNNLFHGVTDNMAIESQFASSCHKHIRSQKPPDLSKEDYFSLLNILII